jgi:rubrerythrin
MLSRTLLLKAEPAGTLHSLEEVFALANAMEQEAANRYAELAEEMRRQHKEDLALVFAKLAAAEREHVESVARLSVSRLGKDPDSPSLVRWDAPDSFDPETATEFKNSNLITPYQALAMAVRNEERAFAFWSYLAAFAEKSEVKKAAEAMAAEELGHVTILRKERRRAYHHEHPAAKDTSIGADQIDAGQLERLLGARLQGMNVGPDCAKAERIRELAQEALRMSVVAMGFGSFPPSVAQSGAQTMAEALADAYLEGAEVSSDIARLETLQILAGSAIARLAWLRSLS